jgi:hypothetical protein
VPERGIDPPFNSADGPPRELVTAVEYLVDDYGLDAVRAALDELIVWYANG